MNTNLTFFLLCPIPEDQKPMKEYLILQENKINKLLFSIIKGNFFPFFRFFFFFFLISFFFFYCFFLLSFKTFFCSFFFTWNLFFFFFFTLFVRWKTLLNRFFQARFFYEESSWYDGQIWEKPSFILKIDRLISIQKINFILKQLFVVFFLFSFN